MKTFMLCCTSVLCGLILTMSGFAHTQDQKHLIIATNIESSPFVINAEEKIGYDADFLSILFARMNIDYTIIRAPEKRLPGMLKSKQVDAYMTWLTTDKRCFLSTAYRYWQNVILLSGPRSDGIQTISDLKGKNIASFKFASIILNPEVDNIIADANDYFEVQSSDVGARMLLSDRVDAYIGDVSSVSYFFNLRAKNRSKSVPLKIIYKFNKLPQFICFSDEPLRDEFEKHFNLFKTSGEYDAFLKEYTHYVK